MADYSIAISWLGAAYSLSEFAGIIAVTGRVNRLITFGQAVISWDTEAPPFEKNRQSALQYLRYIVDADVAAAERMAQKQEEDATDTTGTGVDAGTRTIPATAGLSIDLL